MNIFTADLEETLPGQPTPVVVFCADVEGSTRLYDALGDTRGQSIVLACVAAMSSVTAARGGRVIKTVGDEIRCTFPRPVDALLAAGEMHHAIQAVNHERDMPLGPVRISIGMHRGPALVEADEIFGDTLNIASRLAAIAKPDQTLLSLQIARLLPPELTPVIRFVDNESLDPGRKEMEIYEALWDVDEATDAVSQPGAGMRTTYERMILEMGEVRIELDSRRTTAQLGRGENCDLRYPSGLASRQHARIEFRRGRFAVVDNSVNGTFVVDASGRVISVHRDELTLEATGYLTLGETPDRQGTPIIRYHCE